MHAKITLRTAYNHTPPPYHFIVGAKEEMDLGTGVRQLAPIKTAYRPATDYGNLHNLQRMQLGRNLDVF
jgi:hypothetical protein